MLPGAPQEHIAKFFFAENHVTDDQAASKRGNKQQGNQEPLDNGPCRNPAPPYGLLLLFFRFIDLLTTHSVTSRAHVISQAQHLVTGGQRPGSKLVGALNLHHLGHFFA